jgi:hypothetical protein
MARRRKEGCYERGERSACIFFGKEGRGGVKERKRERRRRGEGRRKGARGGGGGKRRRNCITL